MRKQSNGLSIIVSKQNKHIGSVVGGQTNNDAVWFYPEPKEAAERLGIKNCMAFRRGVEVTE